MDNKSAIIIGSGVAGLAAAIRLASHNWKVTVFEANSFAGGKISSFEKNGYHFDAGPSLFTEPENIEELFQIANEPVSDYFTYTKLDEACRYYFEDGKIINAYSEPDKFASELNAVCGEKAENVTRYLSHSKSLYNSIGNVFLNYSLHKRSTWFHSRFIKALRSLRTPYLFKSLASYNKSCFNSLEANLIFNRFATYNGSNPFKAPAMLSLIPHLEHNKGTYYPAGGMKSIANSLFKLAVKKGVEFKFDTKVQRIINTDNLAKGVVANDVNFFSDVVISNSDIYNTYKYLLQHEVKAEKVARQERSSSAVVFYWGMKEGVKNIGLHNIFFSNNYQEEFNFIFKKKGIYRDPTVYLNVTSTQDPAHATSGNQNWFVMVNTPANYGQDWDAWQNEIRKNVILKLSKLLGKDIESMIECEETLNPVTIEQRTGSYMGALYGSSSNSRFSAFLRSKNFTGYAKNLYHCGGTVHPGGGIPLCLNSAKIVTEMILKK